MTETVVVPGGEYSNMCRDTRMGSEMTTTKTCVRCGGGSLDVLCAPCLSGRGGDAIRRVWKMPDGVRWRWHSDVGGTALQRQRKDGCWEPAPADTFAPLVRVETQAEKAYRESPSDARMIAWIDATRRLSAARRDPGYERLPGERA